MVRRLKVCKQVLFGVSEWGYSPHPFSRAYSTIIRNISDTLLLCFFACASSQEIASSSNSTLCRFFMGSFPFWFMLPTSCGHCTPPVYTCQGSCKACPSLLLSSLQGYCSTFLHLLQANKTGTFCEHFHLAFQRERNILYVNIFNIPHIVCPICPSQPFWAVFFKPYP